MASRPNPASNVRGTCGSGSRVCVGAGGRVQFWSDGSESRIAQRLLIRRAGRASVAKPGLAELRQTGRYKVLYKSDLLVFLHYCAQFVDSVHCRSVIVSPAPSRGARRPTGRKRSALAGTPIPAGVSFLCSHQNAVVCYSRTDSQENELMNQVRGEREQAGVVSTRGDELHSGTICCRKCDHRKPRQARGSCVTQDHAACVGMVGAGN
jgi:hypothetical protein